MDTKDINITLPIKLIEDLLLILESAESDARCNKINEASSKLDYISNKINTL